MTWPDAVLLAVFFLSPYSDSHKAEIATIDPSASRSQLSPT
jgi:hypothetical protein